MLFNVDLSYSLDGRIGIQQFTTGFLMSASVAAGAQALYEWAPSHMNLYKPLFDTRIEIYSLTIAPAVVPGTRKRTRNDHMTRYFSERGTHEAAANVDPALLTVTAQFFKYATAGTAGAMYIRGVLTEDELKSDRNAAPINQNQPTSGAANQRFVNFAAAFLNNVQTLGNGRVVLPGPRLTPTGAIPSLATYEAETRQVRKVEFDGFRELQLRKATTSIESKTTDLLRSMISKLRTVYNDALQDAGNNAAAIPAEITTQLNQLGHVIFLKFTPAERLKVKTEPVILAYIR
jgi:hypothetical protein